MSKNRKHLSVTHAHYAFPTGLISYIGKKLMGIPYVVTVHGGDIDKMAAKSARIANMTKLILQHADSVIVVGEKLKIDVIERFGVEERQVHVMSMGVNTAIFKPVPKAEQRSELSLPQDEHILLYVGNIIREKGLLELVEAFQAVKNALPSSKLYLIGSQKDQQFVQELQSFIREKAVEDIHFEEPIGQIDLAKWIAAADVLVLPSYHEGFGLVALEAMSSGTKVVASDVGGLTYLLKNHAGILVEPRNARSLAEGLLEALNKDSNAFDQEQILNVVHQHSYDVILNNLTGIYNRVGKGQVERHE